jgi:hypothetical protein
MLRRVIFDREGGHTRSLNRILEAAKVQREPKRALSEQNKRGLFLGTGGEALQGAER